MKRLKTEPAAKSEAQSEDSAKQVLQSNCEVHEMFQRVPDHILQEIFGCLDIVEAVKKCR